QPGTITSLRGPNGAGKTTAFNAITGYLRPTRGRVAWEGEPIAGRPPCDIARRGVVRTFQRTSVFPALSVFDNVRTGLHLRGSAGLWSVLAGTARARGEEAWLAAAADEVLAFVGLAHRRDERAGALPYGEQRLVELAVALAARPRLLLSGAPATVRSRPCVGSISPCARASWSACSAPTAPASRPRYARSRGCCPRARDASCSTAPRSRAEIRRRSCAAASRTAPRAGACSRI